MKNNTVKFIDLFAGLGGIRLGFEKAFNDAGLETECVMTSEIKPYAVKALQHNFGHEFLAGNIFEIRNEFVPDFDFLLGGFPLSEKLMTPFSPIILYSFTNLLYNSCPDNFIPSIC